MGSMYGSSRTNVHYREVASSEDMQEIIGRELEDNQTEIVIEVALSDPHTGPKKSVVDGSHSRAIENSVWDSCTFLNTEILTTYDPFALMILHLRNMIVQVSCCYIVKLQLRS